MSEGLCLLSAILKSGGVSSFNSINRDSMVTEDESIAYDWIKEYQQEYKQLPVVDTVEEETEIELPATPENLKYYRQLVADRDMFMSVRPLWQGMKEYLVKTDADKVRKLALTIADVCSHNTPNTGLETAKALLKESKKYLKQGKFKTELLGIPTGYDLLNHETDGYQNGDLIFWVSRPSVGKTYCLLKAAHAAYTAGKKVLIVSMEMTLKQLTFRFMGYHAGINPAYIRKGKLSNYAMELYNTRTREFEDCNRLHFYAGNLEKTPSGVMGIAQHLNPDIIFIDGVYMMQPDEVRYRTGKNDFIGALIDELKKMALVIDRPIFCTSQLNRTSGARGAGGSLETIAFSDAISTHATLIFNIIEPAPKKKRFVLKTPNEEGYLVDKKIDMMVKSDRRHIVVLKGREGDVSSFNINYTFNPPNFDMVDGSINTAYEEDKNTNKEKGTSTFSRG